MEIFSKVILRTPAFPFNGVFKIPNDYDEIIKFLAPNNQFKEAIYISSPSLYNEFIKATEGKIKDSKKLRRIINNALKYYIRMCTRTIPYGLFAGCSTCEIKDKTNILLKGSESYYKHTRLDMECLCNISSILATKENILKQLRFYLNPTIYLINGRYRFFEPKSLKYNTIYEFNQIENTGSLSKILNIPIEGMDYSTFFNLLSSEIDNRGFDNILIKLIESKILIHSLFPNITGNEYFLELLDALSQLQDVESISDILKSINKNLEDIKLSTFGETPISLYESICEQISAITKNKPVEYHFQVDLIKPIQEGSISREIIDDTIKAITAVNKLNIIPQVNEELNTFIISFVERYELREIPLTEALDPETGIGYPVSEHQSFEPPLIEGLNKIIRKDNNPSFKWGRISSFLLSKYIDAIKNNAYQVEIFEHELSKLPDSELKLSDTFCAVINIMNEGVNNKTLLHLSYVGEPNAASYISRFCHADGEIHELVKEIVQRQKAMNPDTIAAEIVHLPDARTGNIIQHPVFHKYEIPCIARPSVEAEHQLDIKDLMISIFNNKIVLRSKKLNVIVTPHLTNAHNFQSDSLPFYNFLSTLQLQDCAIGMAFNWGPLNEEYKFLPRVIYRNTILSLATWNLAKVDYIDILLSSEKDLQDTIRAWRKHLKIPQFITISEGDNELFIDLEHLVMAKLFREQIKNKEHVKLIEFLYNNGNSPIHSPEGTFCNQVIIPLYKIKPGMESGSNRKELTPTSSHSPNNSNQVFHVGSEWMYFKFYLGVKSTDEFLVNKIKLLITKLIKEQLIDLWFFVRYADPEFHLRLRIHLNNGTSEIANVLEKVNLFSKDMLHNGIIWKTQIDTYVREMERYGGDRNMVISEALFYYDSNAVLEILYKMSAESKGELKWLIALKSIDILMNDFDMSVMQKIAIINEHLNSFSEEFVISKDRKITFDEKYRKNKASIESVMTAEKNFLHDLYLYIVILQTRSRFNIKKLLEANVDEIKHILTSLIHMNINRIFDSNQRIYEVTILEMLLRYYKSKP